MMETKIIIIEEKNKNVSPERKEATKRFLQRLQRSCDLMTDLVGSDQYVIVNGE